MHVMPASASMSHTSGGSGVTANSGGNNEYNNSFSGAAGGGSGSGGYDRMSGGDSRSVGRGRGGAGGSERPYYAPRPPNSAVSPF